jgi:hypothetical protein
MQQLEDILLRYESFTCIVGPLACAAVIAGACLLLLQVACCPLLLLGRWGGREAVFLLLATDDELDRVLDKASTLIGAEERCTEALEDEPTERNEVVECSAVAPSRWRAAGVARERKQHAEEFGDLNSYGRSAFAASPLQSQD